MRLAENMKICGLVFALVFVALIHGSLGLNSTLGWQTLTKTTPVIIANGGTSGVYPGQTVAAFLDAFQTSNLPLALLCDLQLTKDNQGICRTDWNLSVSTNLTGLNVALSTYAIQGRQQSGVFSVDYNLNDLLLNTSATQSNPARPSAFDGLFNLTTPEEVSPTNGSSPSLYFWLNVEYPTFYQQHPGKNSLASYLTTFLTTYVPTFLSATEVGILRLLGPRALKSHTTLVFKVLQSEIIEESTNTSYGTLLKNMTNIASFAQGILVPKNLIWPVDNNTNYLQPHTNLVQTAHAANLLVFAYTFANDEAVFSFNYSYDPIQEYLGYIEDMMTVDGVVTDFPVTAAEALNCYPSGYQLASSSKAATKGRAVTQPTIISHNGASGDFPGCTMLSYAAAVEDGADYIDCPVQITSDSVLICREFPDLVQSTNVFGNSVLYSTYLAAYPAIQTAQGVFTFDMSWANISTLRANMYSPWESVFKVARNGAYDGREMIITLDQFLSFAKNNSVGIYIDVQNAYFLRTHKALDVVDGVVAALAKANLTSSSDKVYVAAEDSSALAAFQKLIPHKLVYRVPYDSSNPVEVTLPVLQEIKKYASVVVVPHRLVDPVDNQTFFLVEKTQTAQLAQSQNMTVFYYWLSNEYVAYPQDYRSDPILQINALITTYKMDGFITDFPATLYAFLHDNTCYGTSAVNASMQGNSSLLLVKPGNIQLGIYPARALAPSPALNVAEPPISYYVPMAAPSSTPVGSPGYNSSVPGAGPTQPSSATSLLTDLLLTFISVFMMLYLTQ